MKAVIQRVISAEVTVDHQRVSEIQRGLVTLLGVEKGDDESKLNKIIKKICELRIFEDESGKMNLSMIDLAGKDGKDASHLIVSQFTLAADCSSGRRPSFTTAEGPEKAKLLYEKAIDASSNLGVRTLGGIFQANMKVSLINDGPVTFILEV